MDQNYSTRQQKIGRLVQKEMADIFQKLTKEHFRGTMISVTAVRVTKDLGLARCYLSVFPSDKGEGILKDLKQLNSQLRYELGRRVGKQLRVIPELEYFIDDSLDYIENIDNLLKK